MRFGRFPRFFFTSQAPATHSTENHSNAKTANNLLLAKRMGSVEAYGSD